MIYRGQFLYNEKVEVLCHDISIKILEIRSVRVSMYFLMWKSNQENIDSTFVSSVIPIYIIKKTIIMLI